MIINKYSKDFIDLVKLNVLCIEHSYRQNTNNMYDIQAFNSFGYTKVYIDYRHENCLAYFLNDKNELGFITYLYEDVINNVLSKLSKYSQIMEEKCTLVDIPDWLFQPILKYKDKVYLADEIIDFHTKQVLISSAKEFFYLTPLLITFIYDTFALDFDIHNKCIVYKYVNKSLTTADTVNQLVDKSTKGHFATTIHNTEIFLQDVEVDLTKVDTNLDTTQLALYMHDKSCFLINYMDNKIKSIAQERALLCVNIQFYISKLTVTKEVQDFINSQLFLNLIGVK